MSDTVLDRRVILIGKTGSGKSSTGNTLLRTKKFSAKGGFKAGTNSCFAKKGEVELGHSHYEYTVVDTPGLFDTESPLAKTALMIQSSTTMICPNPHAFLLVFKAGRFTHEDSFTVDMLRVIFGDSIWEHMIVVVTHGIEFKSDNDFETDVREHTALSQIVKKCGNRFVRIENSGTDTDSELMKIFNEIEALSRNGSQTYSYKYADQHEKALSDHLAKYKGPSDVASQVDALVKNLGRWIPGWKAVCVGVAAVGVTGGAAGFVVGTGAVAGLATGAYSVVAATAASGLSYGATIGASVGSGLSYGATIGASVGSGLAYGATIGASVGGALLQKFTFR